MSRYKCISAIFGIILLSAPMMTASALRCGNYIIQEGDSKFRVLKACGKPAYMSPEPNRAPYAVFGNDTWMYNRGPGGFTTLIRFMDGEIKQIKQEEGWGFN